MHPPTDFLPQGDALRWDAGLVWINAISDAAIVLAYYSIPLTLAWYVREKKGLDFKWIYICFAVFIFACGTSHLFEIWTIWRPDYWAAGITKALTAALSLPTAYGLYRLVPNAVRLPSPGELRRVNAALATEIATRKQAEGKLQELTAQLERRVAERTAELEAITAALQREIAGRARAMEALQESEDLFSKAFRLSPDCLVIARLSDRTVLRANEAVCRLWGRSPDQVVGNPTREYTNWEDEEERARFMSVLREKGECLNYEADLRLNDGHCARFKISSRTITIKDEACALTIMTDMTERKKAEETAAWLAAIVESSNDGVIGKDLQGTVTSWNGGAEKILGYAAVEMIGRPGSVLIPEDRIAEEAETMRRLEKGEIVRSMETVRLGKGQKRIEVSLAISPIRDRRGRLIGTSKILRDIGEEKKTEEARRMSDGRYRTLFEYAPDGILIADAESRYIDANPSICEMLGYSHAEMVGLCASDIVVESEMPNVAPALAAILSEAEYHREWQFRRKDGSVFSAEVIATLMPDSNLLGVVRDITERKKAERALREAEQQLHARDRRLAEIMHGMTEACFALDESWRFVFVNDRCERLLGRRRGELLGRSIWEAFSPLVGTPTEECYRKTMRQKTPVAFEILSPLLGRWLDIRLFPTAEGLAAFLMDIHDRKMGEEALRESEARYRGTLDRMMEGCQIIGRDWRYLYVNAVAAQHGRRAAGDLVGHTMQACYPGIEVLPMFAAVKRCMETRHAEQMENTFEYPDGTRASFQLGIQSVPEGVFILSLDITARKLAEAELRRSREQFKDLFDNAPTGYHEVDASGRLVRINQAELKMLGWTEEELLGRFVWEIAANSEASRRAVEAKLAGSPPPAAFERLFKRKDGTTFPVVIEDRLVKNNEGRTVGIRAVVQDITERKRAEEEIRRMNADLERRVSERTAQLESANKELEAFSYSVSHDLRTPLRAMDGFSQAVQEDFGPLLPPEGRHQLKTIRESAQRMGELIDDLLIFSRLSRQSLRKQPVDTGKLVRGVVAELTAVADDRKVEIKIGELAPCEGDFALLRQVWINLVSNALKYTRQRESAVVEIGCNREAGEKIYFVRDNGAGFDMRYAHKLFGVFQRLHRAEEYEGTGVGLAIVQRVVHRHGGRVWATAALNEGALFQFTVGETNPP